MTMQTLFKVFLTHLRLEKKKHIHTSMSTTSNEQLHRICDIYKTFKRLVRDSQKALYLVNNYYFCLA